MASIKKLHKASIRVRELRDTFEGHDASRFVEMYQDVWMCRIWIFGFVLKS